MLFLAAGVFLQAVAHPAQNVNGRDVAFAAFDQRRRDAVDDEARGDAAHALVHELVLQFPDVLLVPVADLLLAVVQLQLGHQGQARLLGRLQARQQGEHGRRAERVRGDMHGGQVARSS